MATIVDIFAVFNVIIAIVLILALFLLIGLIPIILSRIFEAFSDFIERKNFFKKLIESLNNGLVEKLENVEYIFLISCPNLSKRKMSSFYLNYELKFFLGLLNSKYHGIIYREVNFENKTIDELIHWRNIIEKVITENNKKLNYEDLPQQDRVFFKQLFNHFEQNSKISDEEQKFIQSRILEIKQLILQKNKEIKKLTLINYGALFVSIISIVLTIVFGFNLIGL